MIIDICEEWSKRTRFELEYDEYRKVIQANVNNYIIVDDKGKVKSKGGMVKKLNRLDYDLPIVNEAIINYFVHNIPAKKTINECNELIKFQKITKISSKYEYGVHNGVKLNEKVHRCFASKVESDGTLYKKKKGKDSLDKTASTPEKCFIDNSNIENKDIPPHLDKDWYVKLANKRIKDFVILEDENGNK